MTTFSYESLFPTLNFTLAGGYPAIGWEGFSIPDVDYIFTRPPRSDSGTWINTYVRPRHCSLEIMVLGTSPTDYENKMRAITSSMPPLTVDNAAPRRPGRLHIVRNDATEFNLYCNLSHAISVDRRGPQSARVLLDFIAVDPFFYEESFQSANISSIVANQTKTVAAVNTGPGGASDFSAYEIYPELQILAAAGAGVGIATGSTYTNIATGETLTVNRAIAPGTGLVINMAARTAIHTVGGNYFQYLSGRFWRLGMGSNTISVFNPAASSVAISGAATVWYRRYLGII